MYIDNWRIDNPFVGPSKMTLGPTKGMNLNYVIMIMQFGLIRRLNLFAVYNV